MYRLLTTTVLVTCLALPAVAQQDNAEGENAANSEQRMNPARIEASHLTDMPLYMPEAGSASDMASGVSEVPDSWRMIGDIDDMVVTRDGRVTALLVDAGGYLGSERNEREVSVRNVSFVADSDDEGRFFVIFNGDRFKFEQQEQFDEEQARSEGQVRASENERMAQEMDRAPQRREQPVEWSSLTTDELLGAAVYGENGEWVGDLSELSLDENGELEGAIIDVGGFLGIGEKAVMLPIDEVEIRQTGYNDLRAYVSATEEELDEMESWTPET